MIGCMSVRSGIWLFIFGGFLLLSCEKLSTSRFEMIESRESGIDFSNTIYENDSFNVLTYLYIYNGAGVATGDVNNDGYSDIFFSGNMVSNRLYLNQGNFRFEDITDQAGLRDENWCTGVSMVDINEDGFLDIYVSVVSPDPEKSSPNLLFINQGIDEQGIPTFEEQAHAYGIDDPGYSTHAAFFDYDLDGDLDLYVLTNGIGDVVRSVPRPGGQSQDGSIPSTDRLYRNEGDGTFTNVSREAGITIEGWGLGVAIQDINRDGWPDIYVSNDFLTNDLMYINNQDGTFTNQIEKYLRHQSHNGMGTDIADINNDALPDIMVLDMMPEDNLRQKTMFTAPNNDEYQMKIGLGYQHQYVRNTLQLNNGNGTFSEVAQLAGVYKTDWSWAPLMIDLDNDGKRDILISNGYHRDVTDLDYINYSNQASMFGTEASKTQRLYEAVKELKGVKKHNYIYRNHGALEFEDVTHEWGFSQPSYSNGTAYADFDNDGDLDLVMNNINDEAFLYRNQLISEHSGKAQANHYLRISLKENASANPGLGTKIIITHRDASGNIQRQYHDHSIYRGYKSTVEPLIHFGLGTSDLVDTVKVIWPDGKSNVLTGVEANQILTLQDEDAGFIPAQDNSPSESRSIFQPVSTNASGLDFLHQEEPFDDFKRIRLLIHKYSQDGPCMTKGDIDGNGLEDIVIGGGNGYTGYYYLQMKPGRFEKKTLDTVHDNREDMGLLLFDADNDQDLDLYIVSGGSEVSQHNDYYQDRFYLNEGKGSFVYQPEALPEIHHSGSCVVAADYDQDGDQDLFVGGRVNVEKYPYPGKSFILENRGGVFEDVTDKVAPGLSQRGMVTDALWSDYDGDGWIDLVIAGEWMPICIYRNHKGKFEEVTAKAGLENYSGWWNSLAQGDFDQDGDMDYVAGNLGLNSRFKASPDQPVCMYAKDYDQNGSIDPVLCHYIQDKNYPAHPLSQMISQMAGFKKRFIYFSDYGKATYEQAFTKSERAGAYILKSEHFASSYMNNNGDGTFSVYELPLEVQFAPVNDILVNDYTGDGQLDLLIAGNSYTPDTHIGRYDASIGYLLAGNGNGQFRVLGPEASGFVARGDNRSLEEITLQDTTQMIVVAANQDSLTLYKYKPVEYTQ